MTADPSDRSPDPAASSPSTGGPPADRRDRSDRRAGADRRRRDIPVAVERRAGRDRRATPDRRAADPGKTAGGYDLDPDALEFIHAISRFKAQSGKPFPTWSEVLGIVRDLGYEKRRP